MALNQGQVKYVRQRIEDIYSEKKAAIKSKYIWVKVEKTLEEKIALIKSGNFTLRSDYAPYAKHSIDIRIIFEAEENPNLKDEAEAYKKLNEKRKSLLDNLILGNAEEFLEALNSFEGEQY